MQPTKDVVLLKAALRKAGVTLAPGRGPSPEQMSEAIDEENRMIGTFNVDPMDIFSENRALYTTIPNQQFNTIGIAPTGTPLADFNGPRPFAINGADLLLDPQVTDSQWSPEQQQIWNVRRPLRIWDRRDWARRKWQAVWTYPEGLFYDKNCDQNGFGKIYFFPIPDQPYWVELYTWQSLPKFRSPDDLVLLPDGYEDAIVNNLAVRLDQFPWTVKQPMSPSVVVEAQRSLCLIQQMNLRIPRLYTDKEIRSSPGYLNWMTGLPDEH
jgi:hypothetical protein